MQVEYSSKPLSDAQIERLRKGERLEQVVGKKDFITRKIRSKLEHKYLSNHNVSTLSQQRRALSTKSNISIAIAGGMRLLGIIAGVTGFVALCFAAWPVAAAGVGIALLAYLAYKLLDVISDEYRRTLTMMPLH